MIRARWHIVPLETPAVVRRCPRCNKHQRFISSDKFRVNGAGRRLDVWLVYKCDYCEQTWNCTILTRVSPESIPEPLYQAFMDNDEATAHRYAFDRDLMRQNGSELEPNIKTRIDGEPVDLAALPAAEQLELAIDFDFPMAHLRLDTFLAQQLDLPRRALETLFAAQKLTVEPAVHDDLAKKLKRPVVVRLDVGAAHQAKADAIAHAEAPPQPRPDKPKKHRKKS